MRVVVIGAGIGGLTLAQALHRAGIDVSVHDRDPEAAATGGYRLHLDARACAALRRHLSPAHYQALLASSTGPAADARFALADHRMRLLASEPREAGAESLLVGRIPLRVLLTHGIGDRVRFGSEYVGHERRSDGTVAAHFADGTTDTGDVLVGADGAGSRVATLLAGRPTPVPLGIAAVAGRTPLTPATRALVPDLLHQGAALAFGPVGAGVFLTLHDLDGGRRAAVDPATCTEVAPQLEEPALIWGYNAAATRMPADLRDLDGPALMDAVGRVLRSWDPRLRELVAAADPATVAAFRFHACDPDEPLFPWPAGSITALGDAVHAMPPTGGRAAATAIRDADVLAERLVDAAAGRTTIGLAVHDYQHEVTGYAADAVRVSLGPLRIQRLLSRPVADRMARAVTPVLALARAGTLRRQHPGHRAVVRGGVERAAGERGLQRREDGLHVAAR